MSYSDFPHSPSQPCATRSNGSDDHAGRYPASRTVTHGRAKELLIDFFYPPAYKRFKAIFHISHNTIRVPLNKA